jgi:Site-specific DNA methylase
MNYKGGKNASGIYQRIINQIPPHTTYIEPFLGSGAIMRLKKPAIVSIGIDVDMNVIKQWEDWGAGHLATHGDAISFLSSYDWQGDEFVYCDPPYIMSTRSHQKPLYRHEFCTEEEHAELLKVLKSLPAMIAISGYKSGLYDKMLKDWRVISYQTRTRGGTVVTEYLWMNYPQPFELHDYSYLGDNYRERETIRKQQKRWRRMLAEMPALKRLALLDVIQSARQIEQRDSGRHHHE